MCHRVGPRKLRTAGQGEALESPHGMTDLQGNQWEVGYTLEKSQLLKGLLRAQ